MLIDTHCHLDAAAFDSDRSSVMAQAAAAGVQAIVVPAVSTENFQAVCEVAHAMPGGAYALGIHPFYVQQAKDDDLTTLHAAIEQAQQDPRFVAIGEIGLDFFVPALAADAVRDKQAHYYATQLAFAAEFGLPVLVHARRSQDIALKYIRRQPGLRGGIAHAFNGSTQQAQAFIDHGFALGIGGAMTFARALRIRHHARTFDLAHLVLETDAPDIPPAWLQAEARRNTPAQVAGIAQALAELRAMENKAVAAATTATALQVLPRLASRVTAG